MFFKIQNVKTISIYLKKEFVNPHTISTQSENGLISNFYQYISIWIGHYYGRSFRLECNNEQLIFLSKGSFLSESLIRLKKKWQILQGRMLLNSTYNYFDIQKRFHKK